MENIGVNAVVHGTQNMSIDEFGPEDVIIPIMGITGSGKSSFIARCTGDGSGIGHGLQSFTKTVSYGTLNYRGRKIRLIDTPGFDDSELDDSAILNEIALWLGLAYSRSPPLLLSGVIYLHPITGNRMKGSDRSNLAMFKALCGPKSLSCVVLATTMWAKVNRDEGEKRKTELTSNYWHSMLNEGSIVVEHDDTKDSALRILDKILERGTHIELDVQKQLINEGRTVEDTEAGRTLASKVVVEREKAEARLRRTEQELNKALQQSNETEAQELLEQQTRYQAQISAKDAQLNNLKMDMTELWEARKLELERERRERMERRKQREEELDGMKQSLALIQQKHQELLKMPGASQTDVLTMASKVQSQQQEIKKREREIDASILRDQRALDAQKHLESMIIAKKGAAWGALGAAAGAATLGVALAPSMCTIM